MLSGPIVRAKTGAPKQLVVFLHGYGDSGDGLIGLAPYFSADLPDAMFIAPHGPHPCEMGGPGDMGARQWFSLAGWQPGLPWPDEIWPEMVSHGKMLNHWLDDRLTEYNLTPQQLALVGFSQGTIMSLYCAPRREQPIAGMVGFSGALVQPQKLAAEIISRPPVLLVHGEMDTIVSFSEMAIAEKTLKANQVPVQTLARPHLPHGIDDEGIMAATQFLAAQFSID